MTTIQQLLSILPSSSKTAIHAEDIARKLGLPVTGNQVETRQLIREAIKAGNTIVSNTRIGYWLSSDRAEIQNYIDSLERRAADTLSRVDELKNAWNSANSTNQIP